MKHHIALKLQRELRSELGDSAVYLNQRERPPPWEQFILDKSITITSVGPSLDKLFKQFDLSYWVTSEYTPGNPRHGYSSLEKNLGLDRIYRVILKEGRKVPPTLVHLLNNQPEVQWARPPVIAQTQLPDSPNADPDGFSRSGSRIDGLNWPGNMIRLRHAHAISTGDPDIKVAILDTGVDSDHPELSGQFVAERDVVNFAGLDTTQFVGDLLDADADSSDDVGHGTHVAGILGAHGRRMAIGVCPRCSFIAVRVLAALLQNGRRVGAGLLDNINTGIKWAVDEGAQIINMSLGVRHDHGGLPHKEIIEYAQSRGVIIVAAAGNDGTSNKYYPGALEGVVAVGAADMHGGVAQFSSFGAPISFLAPGTRIISSFRGGGYVASSGTSQAAPFVSGALALLKSIGLKRGRSLQNDQILRLLRLTADRLNDRARDRKSGFGVINLADAVKLLQYELSQ